jgi:hypothetical protein
LDAREKKFLVVEKGPRVLNETVAIEHCDPNIDEHLKGPELAWIPRLWILAKIAFCLGSSETMRDGPSSHSA